MSYAFISVFNKDGIVPFAQLLTEKGWYIVASDGTREYIKGRGGPRCSKIKDLTNFPYVFGGRVEGLHPKIIGGMLARAIPEDVCDAEEHHIPYFDLVIANSHPFMNVVESGAPESECIENIGVDGPIYVCAAAKNYERVTVVVDPADYATVMDEITKHGNTSLDTRRELAGKAFLHVRDHYMAIAHWFSAMVSKEKSPA